MVFPLTLQCLNFPLELNTKLRLLPIKYGRSPEYPRSPEIKIAFVDGKREALLVSRKLVAYYCYVHHLQYIIKYKETEQKPLSNFPNNLGNYFLPCIELAKEKDEERQT